MLAKYFNLLKQSTFLRDNLILFIGLVLSGAGGFIYHFFMGRMLGPEDYGSLYALHQLIYLFLIFLNMFQMGIAKFTSQFSTWKFYGKISYLAHHVLRSYFYLSLGGSLFFLLLSPLIAAYLHVPLLPVLLLTGCLFFIIIISIPRGIMQGLQYFTLLSVNNVVEGLVKVFIGPVLVFLGYGVAGAIGSIVVTFAAAAFLGFYHIRSSYRPAQQPFSLKELYTYNIPLGFMLLSMTLFLIVDVIIVKHFLSGTEAGYYSALALLGKILFFGSASIGQVMFSKVAAHASQNKPHKHLFYKSALLTFLFIFPVVFAYFVFPELIVSILFGQQFLPIVPYLGLFSLYMGLFCFIYLFAYYFSSLKHNAVFLMILFFFNILQVVLLYSFHESLTQIITLMIALSLIFFIILYILFTRVKDA